MTARSKTVDRTCASEGLSGHGCKEPVQHRNVELFLIKRSPLSIKEKKKERTEERATLR